MSQSDDEKAVEAVYEHAAELMRNGHSNSEIHENLLSHGLDQSAASLVVDNLSKVRAEQYRETGLNNMKVGAMWAVGGLVITGVTYSMASEQGGTYVVTWGAIVFGAIQFFKGLYQYTNGE